MLYQILLARGNDAANQWLEEHPLVLGLLFLAIGLAVGGWGVYELITGTAYSKTGKELTGGLGKFTAIVRVVAGVGCVAFGLYRMVMG